MQQVWQGNKFNLVLYSKSIQFVLRCISSVLIFFYCIMLCVKHMNMEKR